MNHIPVVSISTEFDNLPDFVNTETSICNDHNLFDIIDLKMDNFNKNITGDNEISRNLSNNLSNVERLVKKLSIMDDLKNETNHHTNDNILREIVKIRPLIVDEESHKEIERNEEKEIYYRRFSSEDDLQPVVDLITKDLSEPYSIYTYRYFIYNWPRMCIMAFTLDGKCIGAIVGKTEAHSSTDRIRGYIAMLAVQKEYRRRLIGSRLVELVIDTMINDGCSEVVLETEITNKSALSLYEKLGFIRDKRLFRYYLNGVDAFRLKLWLS